VSRHWGAPWGVARRRAPTHHSTAAAVTGLLRFARNDGLMIQFDPMMR
jgi:hypothetical protein